MAVEPSDASAFLPNEGGIKALREAVDSCRGCRLYRDATQAVFGAGPEISRLMLAGEQPGDREDQEGEPFVGPAGQLLGEALTEAGIDRDTVYVTNVVKHFKFVPPERGKRRIHKKPSQSEIVACWPWFAAELRAVRPDVVVCLGATAAKAILGSNFRVTRQRGVLLDFPCGLTGLENGNPRAVLATIHPSAVLRATDEERARAHAGLVADLRVVANA